MKGQRGLDLAENFGAEFTRMMNSAKLVPEQAAGIWDVSESHLHDVMAGRAAPSSELEAAIQKHSPLNLQDLYNPAVREKISLFDDTVRGIVIVHAHQSDASRRPLFRTMELTGGGGKITDKSGVKVQVYDYADTAVSRVSESMIIPERIWETMILEREQVHNVPRWAFNKGHFEQQMTSFIGEVTTYWIDRKGNVHPVHMTTGDMEYHVPFVPHLFTKRSYGEGLILAVTYRGEMGTRAFLDSIKDMPEKVYMEKVRQALDRVEKSTLSTGNAGFFVNRHDAVTSESQGVYTVKTLLSGVPFQPDTLGLEYLVPANVGKGGLDIKVDAERWGYVRAESPIKLSWPGHEEILEPNSSFFIKAGVPHSLRLGEEKPVGERYGQVVVMQVKPRQENPWKTLALTLYYAGEEGVLRARKETKQWTA